MEGFIRPELHILGDDALVPEANLIRPAPNRFSHELARPEPFWYGRKEAGAAPDGELDAGARVLLVVHDGGPRCRVIDARGLYVEVDHDSLREL